jgi:hypothetical protein
MKISDYYNKLKTIYQHTILVRFEMLEKMIIIKTPLIIIKKQCRLCAESFIIYIIKYYYLKLYLKLFRYETYER